ncbi:MmpS family transport accessory protein [Lentzea sp. NPDC059081]|uniref:MmpS family transport accessory protein n=1 Tax=Lentzea sp. NPDC059081 TaxID=3346719 RepID=UPI0036CAF3ED
MSQPPSPQPYAQPYQQQPYGGAPQPPKKKSKAPLVIGIIAAFVVLLVIGAALGGGGTTGNVANTPAAQQPAVQPPAAQPPAAEQPAASDKITVVYEVTGAGTATSITYNSDGVASTEQLQDVKLPWSKTIEMEKGKAFAAVLLAQAGAGTPEISAKITANGKPLKDGKSAGQYAVVNVTGDLFSVK